MRPNQAMITCDRHSRSSAPHWCYPRPDRGFRVKKLRRKQTFLSVETAGNVHLPQNEV